MKTKVLIPSVLLLSAVSGLAFGKANVRTFIETTDAQEHIFGEVEEVKSIKQDTKKKVNAPEANYKVGFQYQEFTQKAKYYVNIRFVAAINVENLADVTASWTRTVYNETLGVAKTEANIPVTKAYASLTINDASVTAASLGYDYFVVYVMRNIPQDTAADFYVDAYLTINEAGATTTTDIYSVKGDASSATTYKSTDTTYVATYNYPSAEDDGTYVAKKVRVVDGKTVAEAAPNTDDIEVTSGGHSNKNIGTYSFEGWYESNSYASSQDDLPISNNGTYYAKYICENTLHYWDGSNQVYISATQNDVVVGANCVEYGTRILGYSVNSSDDVRYAFVGEYSTISTVSGSGIYRLTRNGTTDWTIERKVIFAADLDGWANNAFTAAYVYKSSDGTKNTWYNISSAEGQHYTFYINVNYDVAVFHRLRNSNQDGYDSSNDGLNTSNTWNRTVDINFGYDYSSSKITVCANNWDWKDGDNIRVYWPN